MSWATLVGGIISLWNKLLGFLHDKQVADAAVAQATLDAQEKEDAKVSAAVAASTDVARVQLAADPQDRATTRRKQRKSGGSV